LGGVIECRIRESVRLRIEQNSFRSGLPGHPGADPTVFDNGRPTSVVEPIDVAGVRIQQNEVVHLDEIDTVADGLAAPFAGRYTLAHVKEYVDEIVLVSDEEIIAALRLILERCKILTEPSAAASFAALLFDKVVVPKDSCVVCVLSGGNIDISLLKKIL